MLLKDTSRNKRRYKGHFSYYREKGGPYGSKKGPIGPSFDPDGRLDKYFTKTGREVQPTQKRGKYFKYLRHERVLLAKLANTPFIPGRADRGIRRKLRLVYYRILPLLQSRLTHWKDKLSIHYVERFYYNALNIANYSRGSPSRVKRLRWEVRVTSSTERVSLSKQSSIEPGSVEDPSTDSFGTCTGPDRTVNHP